MGRSGRWATKVANFFTDEEEGAEASAAVAKVANSIVLMSYGREEDPERDFFTSRTPNWKLRVFNVIVGLIQLITGTSSLYYQFSPHNQYKSKNNLSIDSILTFIENKNNYTSLLHFILHLMINL
jgi:hypothetical protein